MKAVIMNSRSIAQVAREIGVNEENLGNWVTATGMSMPTRSRRSTSTSELDYAKPSDVRELKMENEFLKKAAAYFARDPR